MAYVRKVRTASGAIAVTNLTFITAAGPAIL
jgi:hypothetical protein